MVITDDVNAELKEKFKAIFEYNKMINAHKDEIKELNQSIKDTFESISKTLEVDPKDKEGKKGITDAYTEFIKEIEMPSWADTKGTVYNLIKNGDYLGLNKLHEEE